MRDEFERLWQKSIWCFNPTFPWKHWCQRLRGLQRGSAAARFLGLRVRIPPLAWMSLSRECCVLSGIGLCVGLITLLEESYRIGECLSVIGKPRQWTGRSPLGAVEPWEEKKTAWKHWGEPQKSQVMPWLRLWFDPRPVLVGFVVDEEAIGQQFKPRQTQHMNSLRSFIYFPTTCFGNFEEYVMCSIIPLLLAIANLCILSG